jgi:DNA (cytosine-5)-methyltransferase 1
MTNPMWTSIDLFAGAGGLSLGLEKAGLTTLAAVELDLWAAQTFKRNFPNSEVWNQDIKEICSETAFSKIKDRPSLVAGGPPCQGFSHSNLNRDSRDPRNSLFIEFLRVVDELKPDFALIENVPGLLTTRNSCGEKVINIISSEFSKIGYVSKWSILQASNFGVAQSRERLFIIASNSEDLLNKFKWPIAQTGPIGDLFSKNAISLWEAISDLPEQNAPYVSPPLNEFQTQMRQHSGSTWPTHHEPMRHTARIVERFKSIGFGESEASVNISLQPRKRGGDGIGKPYSQNSRRQDPDSPCNTIVASSHTNFIHPYFHRNFTVRELMRIQSFPDNFTVAGKRAVLSKKLSLRKGYVDDVYLDQRMQIGNAVPPALAEAIGREIVSALISRKNTNAT